MNCVAESRRRSSFKPLRDASDRPKPPPVRREERDTGIARQAQAELGRATATRAVRLVTGTFTTRPMRRPTRRPAPSFPVSRSRINASRFAHLVVRSDDRGRVGSCVLQRVGMTRDNRSLCLRRILRRSCIHSWPCRTSLRRWTSTFGPSTPSKKVSAWSHQTIARSRFSRSLATISGSLLKLRNSERRVPRPSVLRRSACP